MTTPYELLTVVTATNSAGSTRATSAPTPVVPGPVVSGCPSGTGPIPVAELAPPARLAIDQQTVTPGVVTPGTDTIQLHFRVTACNGRPVQGANVFATPVPYKQYSPVRAATGGDGTVTASATQRSGFPAARRQQRLAVLVRASKPGESILGGVSSRRLVTFRVSLR